MNNITGKRCILIPAFVFCAVFAGALDFGLSLSQELKVSNEYAGDTGLSYTPSVSPWVSAVGKKLSLYLSGSAGLSYEKDAWRTPLILPELTRTEVAWMVSPVLSFTLGRHRFADPSGLVASGLFDGIDAAFSAWGSRFSAGVYYTGLLYKDTADIIMTARDMEEYSKPFALDKSYFASRRILASLQWENPGLGSASSLALGLLGQFDLNDGDDDFHSQYLSARYGLRLSGTLGLEALAVLGLGEPDTDIRGFFAAGAGLTWLPPTGWNDTLSLRGLYSSPRTGDSIIAFVPINALSQGQVFSPSLGGVSVIKAAYTLRPVSVLSLGAEGSYFIRVDTVSFRDTRDALKEKGYFLGAEFFGTAMWMPLPDVALIIGGGAFFPRMGNAFTEDADTRWKASVRLILSL